MAGDARLIVGDEAQTGFLGANDGRGSDVTDSESFLKHRLFDLFLRDYNARPIVQFQLCMKRGGIVPA